MERLDEIVVIPALQTLAERSEVIMIEAMLPWWWRPLVPLVMRKHNKSVHHIFGLVMRMIYHSGPEALTAKLRPDQTIAGPVMGIHFMSLMLAGVETMSRYAQVELEDLRMLITDDGLARFLLGCITLRRIRPSRNGCMTS